MFALFFNHLLDFSSLLSQLLSLSDHLGKTLQISLIIHSVLRSLFRANMSKLQFFFYVISSNQPGLFLVCDAYLFPSLLIAQQRQHNSWSIFHVSMGLLVVWSLLKLEFENHIASWKLYGFVCLCKLNLVCTWASNYPSCFQFLQQRFGQILHFVSIIHIMFFSPRKHVHETWRPHSQQSLDEAIAWLFCLAHCVAASS